MTRCRTLYATIPTLIVALLLSTAAADEAVSKVNGSSFGISSDDVKAKVLGVGVVLLIVIAAWFIMEAIRFVSRIMIYSQRGPFKYIFRNHQRSVTVHSLTINLAKYVIYFTALGYILGEMGVNYTTYLASLSVIGLAVGFGSQGLVQDVVTGFFILFESQFSVGDMVEISGQVGIVEEIGLRTTRLRNYAGAQIIFQNRNIPLVGRYKKGVMEAGVDVAIADVETADRAAILLQQVGEELAKQFCEIIMKKPVIDGLIELNTGERFVRLRAEIWPAQQWVIDAQMVPRIKEIFAREGIVIQAERVVTFFHFPEPSGSSSNAVRQST